MPKKQTYHFVAELNPIHSGGQRISFRGTQEDMRAYVNLFLDAASLPLLPASMNFEASGTFTHRDKKEADYILKITRSL